MTNSCDSPEVQGASRKPRFMGSQGRWRWHLIQLCSAHQNSISIFPVEGWFVASLMYFYAQTFRGVCPQKADKHQVGQPLIQNIPKQWLDLVHSCRTDTCLSWHGSTCLSIACRFPFASFFPSASKVSRNPVLAKDSQANAWKIMCNCENQVSRQDCRNQCGGVSTENNGTRVLINSKHIMTVITP